MSDFKYLYKQLKNKNVDDRAINLLQNYYRNVDTSGFFELKPFLKHIKGFSIYLIISKKDIGKSFQIKKLIKDLKPGEKIAYVRYFKKEIDSISSQWKSDPATPFFIKNNVILSKENPNITLGYCFYINDLQASASLEFENVEYMIVDEVNPLDSKRFNIEKFKQFCSFVSNVERHKKDFKVIMFGNNNGQNALLTVLGVNSTTEAKIIDYEVQGFQVSLFYANFKNRFKGIESQKVTGLLMSLLPENYQNMLNNAGDGETSKLLNNDQLNAFKTVLNIYFNNKNCFSFKRVELEQFGLKYIFYALVKLFEFNPSLKYITPNLAASNVYKSVIYTNLKQINKTIHTLLESKQLYYKNPNDIIDFLTLSKEYT